MRQRDGLVLIVRISAFGGSVWVVARPVLRHQITHLGIDVPSRRDVVTPADAARIAVVGVGLPARVTPRLCIVEAGIEDTCLAEVLTLADGIVHQRRIHLCLHLPRRDTHLRVNDDHATAQIAIFCRGDATNHLYLIDIIGSNVAKVGTGKLCQRSL